MVSVHDVANYMLQRRAMTAMKLQKLVYYAQAWHLAWDDEELYEEPIEAWANGPVVRDLYELHRGQFSLNSWPIGDRTILSDDERETVDAILETYGAKGAQWLSEQTHREPPWQDARAGIPTGARSTATIDIESMRRFYAAELACGRDPDNAVKRQ